MARRIKIAILVAAIVAGSLVAAIIATTTTTTVTTVAGNEGPLELPRIAWEGGPAYWDRFPITKAAGWSNPSFFPVVIWYDSVNFQRGGACR